MTDVYLFIYTHVYLFICTLRSANDTSEYLWYPEDCVSWPVGSSHTDVLWAFILQFIKRWYRRFWTPKWACE